MLRRFLAWLLFDKNTAQILHPLLQPPGEVLPLEALCAQLTSGDIEERRQAAYALGEHDCEPSTSALLKALQDEDLYVKIYAIQSLNRLRCTSAVEPMCQLVASPDVHMLIRSNACQFFAKLQDRRAVSALLKMLQSTDGFARYDAAFALGEIGDPAPLPQLRALTSDETMPQSEDEDLETAWSVGKNAQLAIDKIEARTR